MRKQQETEGRDGEEASPQYCLAVEWKMQHAASVIAVRCIGHRSTLHPASHRTAFLVAQERETGRSNLDGRNQSRPLPSFLPSEHRHTIFGMPQQTHFGKKH